LIAAAFKAEDYGEQERAYDDDCCDCDTRDTAYSETLLSALLLLFALVFFRAATPGA
jgi:hypothetical protein